MKRIFITGSSGFLGQALIKRLMVDGWKIVGLSRSKAKTNKFAGVKWVRGDIRDKGWQKYVRGSDVMVHLAGIHGFIRIPYRERLSVELEGTKNAIEAARRFNVKHFIHLSTAYTHLNTDYARAKNVTKKYVLREINNGFPATIICPVAVYGPGNDTNFSRISKAIKNNRFFFIGRGNNIWSLIYIDDLVNLLIQIINNKTTIGKTYIVSGEAITLNKLVDRISREIGKKNPMIYLPVKPMLVLGAMLTLVSKFGIQVPFTKDTIYNLTSSQNYQTSKELIKLGYKPKIDIKEGMKRTLNEKNSN